MPKVKFTSALKRFFPALDETVVPAATVYELFQALEEKHPGLTSYLMDDSGQLRKHVNVFIKNELIVDRNTLTDVLRPTDEVLVYQALSGG